MERNTTISFKKDMSIEMAEEYILRELRQIQKDDIVILDMARIRTASAESIPLLVIVVYLVYEKTHRFVKLSNVLPDLKRKLTVTGFWNLAMVSRIGHLDESALAREKGENVILPITCIKNMCHMNDVFVVLRQNQSETLSYKLKTTMGQILNLLGENCFDHSGVDKEQGFYAYIEESLDTVAMTVLDMGMGFYNSLSLRYPEIPSDAVAISRVLMENISCRDVRGGCGYFRISSLIDQYAGRIMVRSGDAIVHYSEGRIKHTEETIEKITGCCVLVELNKTEQLFEHV